MKKYKIRQDGTIDLWINMDGFGGKVLVTYNGLNPLEESYNEYDLSKINNAENFLDEVLGVLGRDVKNWHTYDIVIHWGVHNWKFINNRNVYDEETFEKEGEEND